MKTGVKLQQNTQFQEVSNPSWKALSVLQRNRVAADTARQPFGRLRDLISVSELAKREHAESQGP